MPRFSIIIVSWNALHHLKTFLPSVTQTLYNDFEIILADNASADASKAWVQEHFPEIKVVTFDRNYGYCGGNNRAVPYASGDILIFLNNDVKVEPDWLDPLARLFSQNEDIAAAQPKMLSYENPDYFEYAGAAGGYLDRYGYPFCRGRIFDTLEKDKSQYDDQADILWASGAALAVRKKEFQKIGGFDEDFEFHMEEIDLCWQLWNCGYRVAFCPQSVVYHLGGGSLPMDSPRKVYYNYRNSLTMLWKNYSTPDLFTKFPVRLLLDGISAFRELLKGETESFYAIFRAHLHFWRSLGTIHRKRKNQQNERTIQSDPKTLQPVSIIWRHFIQGKRTFSDLFD